MKIITLLFVVLCFFAAEAAKSKDTVRNQEPLIHEYIKLSLWLVFGVIVGVYFEAKMQFRDFVKPILSKGVSGILIAFAIYGLFMFATFASRYL